MGRSKYHPVGLIYYAPQQCYRGYTLLANAGGGAPSTTGDEYATLVDMEGRVCHRWRSDEGIRYGYLLPNGNLLCRTRPVEGADVPGHGGGSGAAVLELDWDSSVVWTYRNPMLHHDHVRLPNGNTLVLFWQRFSPELTAQVQGGFQTDEDPERMCGDVIQEISPDGSVVWEWRAWEHLSVEDDVVCPFEGREEWTHCNSLALTPDGDIIVSFRKTSVVGIVNRASGKFTWKWGPGEVSHQHDATYLDNGRVLVFDNGSHRRGMDFSRVIEVDPATNEIAWEYRGDSPVSFFSFHISGAQRLPNGNTLICEGTFGRIFEVTPSGEITWEYVNPFFFQSGQMGYINWVFKTSRYGPDHPALEGRDMDPGRYANINRLYAAK